MMVRVLRLRFRRVVVVPIVRCRCGILFRLRWLVLVVLFRCGGGLIVCCVGLRGVRCVKGLYLLVFVV